MKILTVVVIVFALLMLPNHIVFLWFDFGDGGNIPLHKVLTESPVQKNAILFANSSIVDVTCCVRLHTLLHVVACCCVLYGVVAESL